MFVFGVNLRKARAAKEQVLILEVVLGCPTFPLHFWGRSLRIDMGGR